MSPLRMIGLGSLREQIPGLVALRPNRDTAVHVFFALFLTVFLTGMDRDLVRRGWLPVPGIAVFASFMVSLAVRLAVGPGSLRAGLWDRAAPFLRRYRTFLATFLALVILNMTYWSGSPNATLKDLLTLPAAFCTCAVAALLPMFSHVRRYRQAYFWFAFAVYCLTVGVDVWRPSTFSFFETRAAGLAMDPNTGAYMACLLAVPLLSHRLPSIAGVAVLFLTGLAIFLTMSRGGGLAYLALYCSYFLLTVARSPGRRLLICFVSTVGVVLLIGISWVCVQSLEFFSTAEGQHRIDLLTGQTSWFHRRVDAHSEDYIKSLSEWNDSQRWLPEGQAAPAPRTDGKYVYIETLRLIHMKNALAAIAASPIWGYGTRFSVRENIRPHNTYVAMWIDFGLPGFFLYIAFLIAGFRSFYRLRFLPGMFLISLVAFWSMFSETIFDERPLFVMLGLLLALPLESSENDREQATMPS